MTFVCAIFRNLSMKAIHGKSNIENAFANKEIFAFDVDGIRIMTSTTEPLCVYMTSAGFPYVVMEYAMKDMPLFFLLTRSYSAVVLSGLVDSIYKTPAVDNIVYNVCISKNNETYASSIDAQGHEPENDGD